MNGRGCEALCGHGGCVGGSGYGRTELQELAGGDRICMKSPSPADGEPSSQSSAAGRTSAGAAGERLGERDPLPAQARQAADMTSRR